MTDSTGTAAGPGGPGEDDREDVPVDATADEHDDLDEARDEELEPVSAVPAGSVSGATARSASGATAAGSGGGSVAVPGERVGRVRSIGVFYRQVVAELRKVIWPTRQELLTYTTVVLVFVIVVTLIVTVFDFAFGQAVLQVFGDN